MRMSILRKLVCRLFKKWFARILRSWTTFFLRKWLITNSLTLITWWIIVSRSVWIRHLWIVIWILLSVWVWINLFLFVIDLIWWTWTWLVSCSTLRLSNVIVSTSSIRIILFIISFCISRTWRFWNYLDCLRTIIYCVWIVNRHTYIWALLNFIRQI